MAPCEKSIELSLTFTALLVMSACSYPLGKAPRSRSEHDSLEHCFVRSMPSTSTMVGLWLHRVNTWPILAWSEPKAKVIVIWIPFGFFSQKRSSPEMDPITCSCSGRISVWMCPPNCPKPKVQESPPLSSGTSFDAQWIFQFPLRKDGFQRS